MDTELQERADTLFERALEKAGTSDPREFYRARLRELKATDPEAYDRVVQYYREALIPSIVDESADPVDAWHAYGCELATLTAPGRAVEIDETGRSHPYRPPTPSDRMVVHLPDGKAWRALVVGLPSELSDAQQAAYDLLVAGRQKLEEEG
jgi:hypothetical protein